ncbi:hypothetical protein GCM10011371_15620 [Novosphingobium marinum]|uniref:EF-hand domain-containing protein n=1 Tax=Novosphingobium marinum TaxID=1514948 RepID=A0A7Z0BVT4_9SPHN|nr:EF-hand domain-containing protein [Novosphingobium marinum]NYH95675.1 hypothetical protein [Novosphingobium marinum]GGC28952.1 hypothetical protein GCM10011371_15620 [Novosphingobium marinum]
MRNPAAMAAILILAGCGAQPDQATPSEAAIEEAPEVATPMPAATLDPDATAKLRSFKGRDTDGDGFITSNENAQAMNRIFQSIDSDGDGTMTVSELNAAREALGLMMLPGSEEQIAEADQDNDGKLTLAEWIANGGRLFKAADANADGTLSRQEFDALPQLESMASGSAAPSQAAEK